MRLIDADRLLLDIEDIEITGAGLKNRAFTKAFRRLFAEVVNETPTFDSLKISNKRCPNCGYALVIIADLRELKGGV